MSHLILVKWKWYRTCACLPSLRLALSASNILRELKLYSLRRLSKISQGCPRSSPHHIVRYTSAIFKIKKHLKEKINDLKRPLKPLLKCESIGIFFVQSFNLDFVQLPKLQWESCYSLAQKLCISKFKLYKYIKSCFYKNLFIVYITLIFPAIKNWVEKIPLLI